MYNAITDQLEQMEKDRAELLKRVEETKGDKFAHADAVNALKAHDIEVGRLLGLK
jgi:hypothetical protein